MERSNAALTKCFLCGGDKDVLFATKYHQTKDGYEPIQDMNKLHGKVVDTVPCKKCKEYIKQGVILISIRDDSTNAVDAYRTGGFVIIKRGALKKAGLDIPECGYAFVHDLDWLALGLPLSEYQKELFG